MVAACVAVDQALGACVQDESPLGHFISASISWKRLEGRKVEFQILSTWRKDFTWPKPSRQDPAGFQIKLGTQLPIVGVAYQMGPRECPSQGSSGDAFTRFDPGDGSVRSSGLTMQVTSMSTEENWLTGVTYIVHEYDDDFKALDPIWSDHYVASVLDKGTAQAYNAVPWEAKFTGCCRQYMQMGAWEGEGSFNFEVKATVDLANLDGSPRIISMPQLFLVPEEENSFQVCALPVVGMDKLVGRTNGTINVEDDDGMLAPWSWDLSEASLFAGDTIEKIEFPMVIDTDYGKDGICARVNLAVREEGKRDAITISCTLGTAMVQGDFEIITLHHPNQGAEFFTYNDPPFGCQDNVPFCRFWTSFGTPFTVYPTFQVSALEPLELRYVVGTVGRPSSCKGLDGCQTPLLSSSEGKVDYTLSPSGEDHQGLPMGMKFSPVQEQNVVELYVVFSASDANTRPGHDVTISSEQRQYADRLDGNQIVDGEVWSPTAVGGANVFVQEIEDTNFNDGFGGATVSLWKGSLITSRPDPMVTPETITEIALASASQVQMYVDEGFEKLDKNLLEQSNRGEIFLMIKRGSGPPIVDISATMVDATYHLISSTPPGLVELYVKYGDEMTFDRRIVWTPCTGDAQPVVVCGAVAYKESGHGLVQSPQSCAFLDPLPKKPPTIRPVAGPCEQGDAVGPDGSWEAMMGKTLKVCVEAVDIDNDDSTLEVNFASPSGIPTDKPGVSSSTGRITDIYGVEGPFTFLGNQPCQDQLCRGFRGIFEWTPSPYQGGWSGEVCLVGCVSTGSCPGTPGGPEKVCSTSCIKVHVPRCSWYLQNEDSFIEIAPRFHTNWLQLWYLNPGVGHPDFSLSVQQESINVGRVYLARWDDTMEGVAKRFGMSVERLIDVNADLMHVTEEEFAESERPLCIIPNSCSLSPTTSMTE